jgi:hypothetical protein
VYQDSNGNFQARNYQMNPEKFSSDQGNEVVLAFNDFSFDNDAMVKNLDSNYIWDYDVSSSGLRIRFMDKQTN